MAIYSLSMVSVGRSTHAPNTASAHVRYITRRSAAVHVGGARMPLPRIGGGSGAAHRWLDDQEQADRINARVVTKIVIALPHELTTADHIVLMDAFCQTLTLGRASYLYAIHRPSADGDQRNAHAHVVIRDRDIETGRAVIGMSNKGSTDLVREHWENFANNALVAKGVEARIDRRSNVARGLDASPTIHVGPKAMRCARKGLQPRSAAQADRRGRNIDWVEIDQGRSRVQYNKDIAAENAARMRQASGNKAMSEANAQATASEVGRNDNAVAATAAAPMRDDNKAFTRDIQTAELTATRDASSAGAPIIEPSRVGKDVDAPIDPRPPQESLAAALAVGLHLNRQPENAPAAAPAVINHVDMVVRALDGLGDGRDVVVASPASVGHGDAVDGRAGADRRAQEAPSGVALSGQGETAPARSTVKGESATSNRLADGEGAATTRNDAGTATDDVGAAGTTPSVADMRPHTDTAAARLVIGAPEPVRVWLRLLVVATTKSWLADAIALGQFLRAKFHERYDQVAAFVARYHFGEAERNPTIDEAVGILRKGRAWPPIEDIDLDALRRHGAVNVAKMLQDEISAFEERRRRRLEDEQRQLVAWRLREAAEAQLRKIPEKAGPLLKCARWALSLGYPKDASCIADEIKRRHAYDAPVVLAYLQTLPALRRADLPEDVGAGLAPLFAIATPKPTPQLADFMDKIGARQFADAIRGRSRPGPERSGVER